jgi:hypothetical protein
MSAIENQTKPILLPLLLGLEFDFDADAARQLTEWITLKVTVAEVNSPGDGVVPQSDRTAFMQHRTIPNHTQIWIGRIDSRDWSSAFLRHAATLSLRPEVPADASQKEHTSDDIWNWETSRIDNNQQGRWFSPRTQRGIR